MGILIGGKYYKDPKDAPLQAQAKVGAQLRSYDLESTAKKHDMDLIQPYLGDGTPNPDFIKYYPKEAQEYGMEGA